MAPVQLRLLSFATSDLLKQELAPAFAVPHYDAQISCGGFGNVIPELLESNVEGLDAVIIQMDSQGFFDRDWRHAPEHARHLLETKTSTFMAAIEKFMDSHNCPLFINSLPSPTSPSAGFLDPFHTDGAGYLASYFNQQLGEIAQRHNRITLIDTNLAMTTIAPCERSDAKLWLYGRIPYSMEATKALAQGFSNAFALQNSKPVKVLALDLDNTLWRGTYGEDGMSGLDCNDDFPGNAFKTFQEQCLRLKGQGLLLVILSKNDEDVLNVFDEHPGMVLRRDDFVGHRINWNLKSDNIRSLAQELNLGLDSFVFLDDSPHEREAMRHLAPEVRVPELPADPAVRSDFLRNYTPTWPLRLTEEDRQRSDLYAVQSRGRALKSKTASFEDYLTQLGQRLYVEEMTTATLPRIAQMHARTNQFNPTARRISEAELAAMLADNRKYRVFLGRLNDNFGSHGIVACATARLDSNGADLITFLMSCRVIGREIERAFLAALVQHFTECGIDEVEATVIPTERNAPSRDLFKDAGFSCQTANGGEDGTRTTWLWRKDLDLGSGSDFVTTEFVASSIDSTPRLTAGEPVGKQQ